MADNRKSQPDVLREALYAYNEQLGAYNKGKKTFTPAKLADICDGELHTGCIVHSTWRGSWCQTAYSI